MALDNDFYKRLHARTSTQYRDKLEGINTFADRMQEHAARLRRQVEQLRATKRKHEKELLAKDAKVNEQTIRAPQLEDRLREEKTNGAELGADVEGLRRRCEAAEQQLEDVGEAAARRW